MIDAQETMEMVEKYQVYFIWLKQEFREMQKHTHTHTQAETEWLLGKNNAKNILSVFY